MKNGLKRFFIRICVLFLIICVISQVLFSSIFETYIFPGRIICIGFIWMLTCVSYYWLMTTVHNKPKAFNRVFMVQTTVKLLLYLACLTIYLLIFRQYAIPFIVHFLVVYLVFAVFEVLSILKFIKNKSA